jgi:cytochrome c556
MTVITAWRRIATACLLVVATATYSASPAQAHGSAEGVVKERMDMMKVMRDAMKALRPMMDAPQVDQAAALPLADKIASLSPRLVKHFPEGSGGSPSEALPAVWQDWEGFTEAADQAVDKANALVDAIKRGEGETALRAYARLAKACKDCHDDFKAD